MKMKTYLEIANSFPLWREFADPSGLDSEAAFDAMPIADRLDFLARCFGPETGPEAMPRRGAAGGGGSWGGAGGGEVRHSGGRA